MTGDGQLVELAATAQYRLDPRPESLRRHAFGATGADEALRPLAESAVRAVVGLRALDDLLTHRRREAELAAAGLLRRRAASYGLGVVIVGVAFRDVHPPLAVVDAYRDVSRAERDRRRRIIEGETYLAEQLAHRARTQLVQAADALVEKAIAREPVAGCRDDVGAT